MAGLLPAWGIPNLRRLRTHLAFLCAIVCDARTLQRFPNAAAESSGRRKKIDLSPSNRGMLRRRRFKTPLPSGELPEVGSMTTTKFLFLYRAPAEAPQTAMARGYKPSPEEM